ncbi:MAG: amidohydrolase family protein [Bacteroidetes bacterium]|nr:amidohydrolase family protein [Bacteroidota bacterium]HET6243263.1 amidohydrolase family protein [Bacteroidia bacterium]
MRKFSANYILPVSSSPIENGVVIIHDDGTILDVISPQAKGYSIEGVEKHEGIICPGFINTHCHLELSHLKNKITPSLGLPAFVRELQQKRNQADDFIQLAIKTAEEEMIREGIVAVGDVSNSNHSFKLKSNSSILYHTFIEVFGFDSEKADLIFKQAHSLKQEYYQLGNNKFNACASIVPHAPYSVSEKLFKKIGDSCYLENGLLSMHNQESEDENLLFLTGKGKIREMLEMFSLDFSQWKPSGFNSLPTVLVQLPVCNKILLVHNTFTAEQDLKWVNNYSKMVWWCLCPGANMYIEGKLPPIDKFIKAGLRLTLGTDSLASNGSLSILNEIKTISKSFPEIPLDEMIKWATLNGADFLGFKTLGSLEKGKNPGLNLIQNPDLENFSLTDKSSVKKLI